MPTKYVRAAGGAWGDAATWALTSGGTEVTTVPTAADDVVTDSNSGASTVGANISVKSFVQTGTPGAVTNNGFTISSAGNVTLLSGKYIAASNAARISITAAGTLTTGGNAMGGVTLAAAAVCGDNLTFIADKLCTLILNGNFLDVNGKTISGNSATNRLLIYSNIIGTSRTVTVAGGSFANCDFRDIAFANGGADLDLSAITGGSGDCGGNSMSGGGVLTFTAPSTQTFASTGGNWSDIAKWTSRVPLPQDLARFQPMSAGQTITVDMPRLPDTSFAGCGSTNLPSVAMTANTTNNFYGSLNLTGVGTYSSNQIIFMARTNASLTSAGKQLTNSGQGFYIKMPGATFTLNDAIICGDNINIQYGNIVANYSVTAKAFQGWPGTNVTMGNILFSLIGAGNNLFEGTVTAGLATIALTYTGATATTFAGGTNTYNDIQIAPGAGVLTFSGAFTFRNMTMSSAGTRSIVFTKGTTYTMTGDSFLNGAGVDDAPIITPSLLNGGFETAGAGGADVFANWAENGSSINAETVNVYSGTNACRIDVDGANNAVSVTQPVLSVGVLYKVSLWAKTNTGSPTLAVGTISNVKSVTLSSAWTQYIIYFIADISTFRLSRLSAAGCSLYIDNITLQKCNSIVIESSGAGEPFTISKASGLIASNYLAIKDCIATGGATWLAGYNSTDISGNTGWHFNSPASGAGVIPITAIAASAALATGDPQDAQFTITSPTTSSKALATGVPEPATFTFASPTLAAMAKAYTATLSATINFTSSAIAKVLANATPQPASFTFTASSPLAAKALAIANQINASFSFIGSFIPTITVWQLSNFKSAFNRRLGIFKSAHKRR